MPEVDFQHAGDAFFVARVVELLRADGHGDCAHVAMLEAAIKVAGVHGIEQTLGAMLSGYGQLIAAIWRSAPGTKNLLDPTGALSALVVALAETKQSIPNPRLH
ncbi:MAG TPA: hypothetical protein PKZ99_09880 [Azospirillaceae bacterium]|nr:hypothetical protein [Azospirillaceae bacterium]